MTLTCSDQSYIDERSLRQTWQLSLNLNSEFPAVVQDHYRTLWAMELGHANSQQASCVCHHQLLPSNRRKSMAWVDLLLSFLAYVITMETYEWSQCLLSMMDEGAIETCFISQIRKVLEIPPKASSGQWCTFISFNELLIMLSHTPSCQTKITLSSWSPIFLCRKWAPSLQSTASLSSE